ncbi:hypothetical protein [Undibacterium sp. RuTC16W]|uniref:hypothetical protein n=1 Tax=Undibacterium sp. RuTC16W TaxID=3413048 RepID=UPI003BF417E2
MINLKKLEELASDVSVPPGVRRISSALAAAINDWPTRNVDSLELFLSELRQDFGELSKANICIKMNSMTDAWKLESLSELLGAWNGVDEHIRLDDLVQQIIGH